MIFMFLFFKKIFIKIILKIHICDIRSSLSPKLEKTKNILQIGFSNKNKIQLLIFVSLLYLINHQKN